MLSAHALLVSTTRDQCGCLSHLGGGKHLFEGGMEPVRRKDRRSAVPVGAPTKTVEPVMVLAVVLLQLSKNDVWQGKGPEICYPTGSAGLCRVIGQELMISSLVKGSSEPGNDCFWVLLKQIPP